MKHTPAPWKTWSNDLVMNADETETICIMYDKYEESLPNAEANANLIAAAPELLEALQEMYLQFDKVTAQQHEAMQKAHKALKKARGRNV